MSTLPILPTTSVKCIVPNASSLGEGVIWHTQRQCVLWFDITGSKLMTYDPLSQASETITLPVMASAAMLTHHADILLLSTERGIELFDFRTKELSEVMSLNESASNNRSNDGKSSPTGAFWVSTMDKQGAAGTGAIYRVALPEGVKAPLELSVEFLQSQLRIEKIISPLSIPNSLCFDDENAYYCDTPTRTIRSLKNATKASSQHEKSFEDHVFTTTEDLGGNPDGSTIDRAGRLWNARWGTGEVIVFSPHGEAIAKIDFPVSEISCVAFGGSDLKTLYVTSARESLSDEVLAKEPLAGGLFEVTFPEKLPILANSLPVVPFGGRSEPLFGETSNI